jgi:hypothetical protein
MALTGREGTRFFHKTSARMQLVKCLEVKETRINGLRIWDLRNRSLLLVNAEVLIRPGIG